MSLYKEIKKCFPKMEKRLDKAGRKKFSQCNYSDLSLYHFGFGTWIRNSLLQNNGKVFRAFSQSGIKDKDEMSTLMIQLFYLDMQDRDKNSRSEAEAIFSAIRPVVPQGRGRGH